MVSEFSSRKINHRLARLRLPDQVVRVGLPDCVVQAGITEEDVFVELVDKGHDVNTHPTS